MELTFMPKSKGPSLGFLEKFKGKMSKLNRNGRFQRVVADCINRYQSIDLQTRKSRHLPIKRAHKFYSSNSNSRANSTAQVSRKLAQSCQAHHISKKTDIAIHRYQRVPSRHQNKQNIDDSNISEVEVSLPQFSKKQIALPKCSNKIRSRFLQKKEKNECQVKTIRSRILYAPLHTIQHLH